MKAWPDPEAALDLLRRIIRTPSPTRNEAKVRELLHDELQALGLKPRLVGANLLCEISRGGRQRAEASGRTPAPMYARAGGGQCLMFNTHMDTVPAARGYTRDPFGAEIDDGKVWGLGSNDAGGSIVSMIAAMIELQQRNDWQGTLQLALVVEEEVNGPNGTDALLKEIGMPDAAVVGEPTALNICVAQKGMLIIDCVNTGVSCHAANAWRVEHRNAILEALPDIRTVSELKMREQDPFLGPTTFNVTTIAGGTATNSIPDRCEWAVDVRVNPAHSLQDALRAVQGAIKAEVKARSIRLHPFKTAPEEVIVQAAISARPAAKVFGSDTMSDAVFLRSIPVIKAGPGITEMSHKPDEYLETRWIEQGISFYRETALRYFAMTSGRE